jgi:dUTP pyrophosphatase
MTVRVALLREDWADPEVPLPAYETAGAAGADVRANLAVEQREAGIVLAPGARALVPTGLRWRFPMGSRCRCGHARASR